MRKSDKINEFKSCFFFYFVFYGRNKNRSKESRKNFLKMERVKKTTTTTKNNSVK